MTTERIQLPTVAQVLAFCAQHPTWLFTLCDAYACPVGRYLADHESPAANYDVIGPMVHVSFDPADERYESYDIETSADLLDFINWFDHLDPDAKNSDVRLSGAEVVRRYQEDHPHWQEG